MLVPDPKSQSPQSGQWHSYVRTLNFESGKHLVTSQSPQSGQWHSYVSYALNVNPLLARLNPLNRVNGILILTR